jgi:glycosyltransferase involved in cell wall biosynthesis
VLLEGPLEAEDGCAVVVEQFLRVQRGSGSGLSLALLGRGRIDLRESLHVRLLGDLSEGEARAARAGALAVLAPSPREALAHRALRAWEVARPVLADARSAVMRGVLERTGGGLGYRGSAELGAVLALLAREPGLADALGRQGARALAAEHGWPGVLERCERLFAQARGCGVDAA